MSECTHHRINRRPFAHIPKVALAGCERSEFRKHLPNLVDCRVADSVSTLRLVETTLEAIPKARDISGNHRKRDTERPYDTSRQPHQ